MENAEKFRVYMIDDHPLLVKGIAELINNQRDLKTVGSSAEWTSALKEITALKPDLVILDINLPGINGIEVLKNLKVHIPEVKVLILSMHDEILYAMRAIKAGAQGYIMKMSATEEIVDAIRQIVAGEMYLSPKMAKLTMQSLVGRKKEGSVSPLDNLSDRELEVFQLIGAGLTTRQIAEKLHLSVKTIETHKAHIKDKLHLETSTQLAQHAILARD